MLGTHHKLSRRTVLAGSTVALAPLMIGPACADDTELFEALAAYHRQADLSDQIYADQTAIYERVQLRHPEIRRHFWTVNDIMRQDDDLQSKIFAECERAKPFQLAFREDLKASGYDEDGPGRQAVHERRWALLHAAMATPAYSAAGLAAKIEAEAREYPIEDEGGCKEITLEDWNAIVADIRRLGGVS